METICDDLFIGDNWKLTQDANTKQLLFQFYDESNEVYETVTSQDPPSKSSDPPLDSSE